MSHARSDTGRAAGERNDASADHNGGREPLEIGIAGDEGCPKPPGGSVDERVGHGEAMGEGQIGCLEGEGFVHGRDGRAAESGDGFNRTLLVEVAPDHLVDFVHLDGADEERLTTLDVGGEAIRVRPVGQVLDPAARIDQDQWRSFFSRRPLALTPRTMPRYARGARSGTRKITPPLSRTVIRIPGRSLSRSRAPRGTTS